MLVYENKFEILSSGIQLHVKKVWVPSQRPFEKWYQLIIYYLFFTNIILFEFKTTLFENQFVIILFAHIFVIMKYKNWKRGWWWIEMFGEEGSMYWIDYKLFVCLGSYSRPHIIGIKAGWFGKSLFIKTISKSLLFIKEIAFRIHFYSKYFEENIDDLEFSKHPIFKRLILNDYKIRKLKHF